jgi:hypothetical protein
MAVGIGRILGRFFAGGSGPQRFVAAGVVIDPLSIAAVAVSPTWGAAVAIDTTSGTGSLWQRITATSNVAFTIGAPTTGVQGQQLLITLRNASGGALGAATFNAIFKLGAAWTNPANATSRSITFVFDGTNWVEIGRTAADVAN